jgi:hypothetical protein
MLYGGMIAVCSEIHTKHINSLCGQNVELLCVKPSALNTKQRLTAQITTLVCLLFFTLCDFLRLK